MSDTDGQDKSVEEKPQSELPADEKNTEDKLPEEVKDRTKEQFEKLKKSNQELSKKLEAYESKKQTSVLDSFKPEEVDASKQPPQPDKNLFEDILKSSKYSHLNQNEVDSIKERLVDENGYLNADVLVQTIKEANDRAANAEQRAINAEKRFENYEETTQIRKVHKKYPQLDPNNTENFDKKFYDAVRNELIGQYIEGKKDVMLAANKVADYYSLKSADKEKKETVEKTKEQKANINAGLKSSTQNNQTDIDDDELVRATIRGEKGALAERLKRAGY